MNDTYPADFLVIEEVAGFPLGFIYKYWRELLAFGYYMQMATMQGSEHLPTTAPIIAREDFVKFMADSARIPVEVADRVTTLLTMQREPNPDPALTPLVPLDGGLLPLSSLMVPASPYRNALRIMQTNGDLSGRLGNLLGEEGEKVVSDYLRQRMSDETLVTTRVSVKRAGNDVGDLDVVVCDPHDKSLAIFEIRWHLSTDGNIEIHRIESAAADKRAKLELLRDKIESKHAVVRWPKSWPDVSSFSRRWFVLTRDVLVTRHIDDNGIAIGSHQLLRRYLGEDASVKDLIRLLDHPPIPDYYTEWVQFRFGDLQVHVEEMRVRLLVPAGLPFPV